jgi:hypothetical protein
VPSHDPQSHAHPTSCIPMRPLEFVASVVLSTPTRLSSYPPESKMGGWLRASGGDGISSSGPVSIHVSELGVEKEADRTLAAACLDVCCRRSVWEGELWPCLLWPILCRRTNAGLGTTKSRLEHDDCWMVRMEATMSSTARWLQRWSSCASPTESSCQGMKKIPDPQLLLPPCPSLAATWARTNHRLLLH